MADLKAIKLEIKEAIEQKYTGNSKLAKILEKVKEELGILSSTDGIGNKNNLEVFHNIWKSFHAIYPFNKTIYSQETSMYWLR